MTSTTARRAARLAVRVGISALLALSGVIHAYLYTDGYRYIPTIGPAFLLQASVFCAVAVLILAAGPDWLRVGAAVLSVGALVAFALSRTVGLLGFTERGWVPTPYAALSVAAEVLTVVLCASAVPTSRRQLRELWSPTPQR
jgi:hypothetical protein